MDANKSFIFMAIMTGVLIIMIIFFQKPQKEDNATKSPDKVTTTTTEPKEELKSEEKIPGKSSDYELINITQEKEYDLTFENKNIKVVFSPNDAIIKHAYVKDTFLGRKEIRSYDLVEPRKEDEGALRLKFGSWENEVTLSKITGGNNLYHYERIGDTFIFKCELKKKIDNEEVIYTIIKKYEFIENDNIFKLDIEIFNNKNYTLNFDNTDISYSIGWGPLLGTESRDKKPSRNIINKFSYAKNKDKVPVTSLGNSNEILIKKGGLFGNTKIKNLFTLWNKEADDSWIASDGHYFAALILSDNQNYKYFFDFRDKTNSNYYCGLSRYTSKSNLKSTFYVYIGPKIGSVLKNYNNINKGNFKIENTKISVLEEKIMFGIGNIIGVILEYIYKFTKNYGFAIIILTIFIKLILSPLTHKSMVSQQKMSQLQPKIKEIQEKYKDNPQQLNKETMALYKREGINPLGGCLPMLLQLPILFAMWNLLNGMVALKGANFIFWIKDLSVPDTVFNFGFTIPFANISTLNILPIVMVAVQIVSSYLMQDAQSNKQAKIMMWSMSIFMFVIFYNSSSALVLYWTVMNALNLAQQFYLKRFHPKESGIKK